MSNLTFARTDTSILGRWWWTVDRWLLATVFLLVIVGMILLMAAGPAAADRIHADPFMFVRKQFFTMPFALALMLGVSMLSPLAVRKVGLIGFAITLLLLVVAPALGSEIKGSTRWLYIGGVSIQPSEFAKPCFAVVSGWVFSARHTSPGFPGYRIAVVLWLTLVGLLIIQPDLGQSMLVTAMWAAQFFLAGLHLFWVALLVAITLCGAVGAYFILPHVQKRVDSFLNPEGADTYQIQKAMQAFRDGGLFGRGPGEGTVKAALPDSHTDFIFAVAGEEFGMLVCLLVVGLFAFLVIRGMSRVMQENNLFVIIATGGLLVQFGTQAMVNMASSLHLMPTKGMTLPFISYGGSSIMGLGLGMGFILALTRKRWSSAIGETS
ncbi:FtsW/RodA/SpoVE family cell cycle protein [Insolitispirillum peregrinum]|uniref:FtsW/RodA/SpoVE family cell cycle protein n=1 Tax=Insolitispirillum peregrinum TaxID=80876 RepID=UPI00360A4AB2